MTNCPDPQRVSKHFRNSIETYDNGAQVQKEVGRELINHVLKLYGTHCKRVLEIGCCTGSMTEMLCSSCTIDELLLNDLVLECCERTAERVADTNMQIQLLPGDIESIIIPSQLDLILSSSTFQWLKDLGSTFDKCGKALAEGGYFIFSMFGPGTMQQVKDLTGIGLHYISTADIKEKLADQFTIQDISTSQYRLFFQSPRQVLRHIQQTGVGGVGDFRWTPGTLKKFEHDYQERFGEAEGMPLDYVSTLVVARKRQE